MLKFLRDWTLPVAMLIGVLAYPLIVYLTFLTPYLIFAMLFLTFSKVLPRDLKPTPLHGWLLLIQAAGAPLMYWVLSGWNPVVAQAALVCLICPTATAAAVVTQKLGGNAASLTTYTLASNLLAALAVPILFPLVESHEGLNFLEAFSVILQKVFVLLILPFLASVLTRQLMPRMHTKISSVSGMAFYLWGISLAIVTATTFQAILQDESPLWVEISIALIALFTCVLQFFVGKSLGSVYHDRISGGQALGQKNTILAIWMAHTYLNPISALGPGAYVLWQNIINSWQLWKKRKKEMKR